MAHHAGDARVAEALEQRGAGFGVAWLGPGDVVEEGGGHDERHAQALLPLVQRRRQRCRHRRDGLAVGDAPLGGAVLLEQLEAAALGRQILRRGGGTQGVQVVRRVRVVEHAGIVDVHSERRLRRPVSSSRSPPGGSADQDLAAELRRQQRRVAGDAAIDRQDDLGAGGRAGARQPPDGLRPRERAVHGQQEEAPPLGHGGGARLHGRVHAVVEARVLHRPSAESLGGGRHLVPAVAGHDDHVVHADRPERAYGAGEQRSAAQVEKRLE